MERPSQILAMRVPRSDCERFANGPDQRFGEHAAAATFTTASYHAARAHRSFSLVEIIVAAIQAVGAIARRAHAHYRQRRRARAMYDALRQLDEYTLRDLGFHHSEIRSVAAEVTGEAEHTRVRALLTLHGLP